MLTGGTGFVGRFLLAQLLQDTDATLYCLMRARSTKQALSLLKETLLKWDLWRDEFERRIVPVPGDLRLPHFGVDELTYRSLCQNIDSIYHCGASMNHLETYAMAKRANVEGVRELLKIATRQKPKLINYISTLGIFSPIGGETSRLANEETPIDYEKHRSSHGYTASKWVGEKLFMTAAERGIPCNIFRLGLVWADAHQGRYDHLQRGYRILKSCLLSGRGIKNYRVEMPLTPVDYVARAIVYLANQHREGGGIFHISASNPMTGGLFERYNETAISALDLISFYEWIQELKRLHNEGRSLPAVPLLDFAFSMDEVSFEEHLRVTRSVSIRFDCSRTHRELEYAGIVAPESNDDLITVCINSMLSRDSELRPLLARRDNRVFPRRRGA
jgi:thioester reductase-like protein